MSFKAKDNKPSEMRGRLLDLRLELLVAGRRHRLRDLEGLVDADQ